jgi:hypothetical protein
MSVDEMVGFVKAVADADRLRIVGLLAHRSARLSEISETLGLHPSDTWHHMEQLLQSGVVRLTEGTYALDAGALESLTRRQFTGERPAYTPEADLGENTRRVLAAHLNPDGTLKTIPIQPAKRHVILDYLVNSFTAGVNYTEKEVNVILAHFHPDTASLRRYLVDAGMLARQRDGSRYWRPR